MPFSIFENVKSCDIQTFSAKILLNLEVLELACNRNVWIAGATPNI